jgi:WD40 repeat protein/DNA-binding SARP family transcriptional activator
MAKLDVSLLGRFQVQQNGDPVEIPSHAAQSLFAYLILNAEVNHRRERLAGMFWPDSDETNARSNLRHALWRIRRGIGEDIFVADKTTVALNPESDYAVDASSLGPKTESARDLEDLLQAANQYHGDLLPGFYDDWVILERERLRGAYGRLMERLLEGLIEAKRWPEASEWAERWIALGHVPEPAFRALMVAHSARGDQAGVAAVYRLCIDTLVRELGVEPSPQTRLLHEQLMEEGYAGVLTVTATKERYELGEEIGRGGMGEVYRATDTWLEREVAVKLLSNEALGPEGRERLLAEAQAAARLNHPNVVSVYDVGEIDGEPFIVMELVEGETLHAHRPESQGERLAAVLEICAALDHAHAQGIVHRDLKPENVMLAPDGTARLMDFGLASRRVEAPDAAEGGTAGTVYYLSPEVLKGEPAMVQSDLYALGVLLYELLTGELPFTGEDPIAVITQHLESEPKPPSELDPEIRPALEALILRLLSKRPTDRPLSAAAVAEVLEAVAPEDVQAGEPAPGEPPFKGLEYYDVKDAEIFFGREALVERLMKRLRDERFLAVIVGASGSGKSSIARAGLVPALSETRDDEWIFRLMTPTQQPLTALSEALMPHDESEAETAPKAEELANESTGLQLAAEWLVETEGAKKLLLVVDQLEELFTLCRKEQERAAFIDNLLSAVDPEKPGPIVVVITLRADFYSHCAAYPALRDALARNQEYIGPMSTSELRRAIEEPALRGGWKFQSGLVDLMLRDVRGEPGALPLLSHALLETWKRRSRRTMTLRGYAHAGGVRRAIARTAENVCGGLSEEQRAIARNIFLRLTELGEGTEDTRRRVTHSELIPEPGQNGTAEQVLATLAEARLITLSEEHVEVAHEALIREWPRLRSWLDEDREGLRIHRHLTEAAQAWDALARDPGELYRGGRLTQTIEWNEEHQPELNLLEKSFLDASTDEAERKERERETRRRRTIGGLATGLGIALVLALLAGLQWQRAEDEEQEALRQASLGLAALAVDEMDTASPERAVLLAVEALENYPYTGSAESALARSVEAFRPYIDLPNTEGRIRDVAWSPDGDRIVTVSLEGLGKIWDANTGIELSGFGEKTYEDMDGVAWLSDGTRIATTSQSLHSAHLWDVMSGKLLMTYSGHNDGVNSIAPTRDGKLLLTASADSTGRVWDVETGDEQLILEGHLSAVMDARWSIEENRILTASTDGTVRIWDAVTGIELRSINAHTGGASTATWSPDGALIASAGVDGALRIWNAETGEVVFTLVGHDDEILDVDWSADGSRIASSGADSTVRVWDARVGDELLALHGLSLPLAVAWSPSGERLVAAEGIFAVRVWDLSKAGIRLGNRGVTIDAQWSPDMSMIATTGAGSLAHIWDSATGELLRTFSGHALDADPFQGTWFFSWSPSGEFIVTTGEDHAARVWDPRSGIEQQVFLHNDVLVHDADWSPDGTRIATGTGGVPRGAIYVWDVATGDLHNTFGKECAITSPSWSPDGKQIVSQCFSEAFNDVVVWDAVTGERVVEFAGHTGHVHRPDWSPDGQRIVSGSIDETVRIWDARTAEEYLVFTGHSATIWDAEWSPDGTRIASGDEDGFLRIWDAETGDEVYRFEISGGIVHVEWSPDGKYIIVGGAIAIPEIRRVWQSSEELITYAKECCAFRELTGEEREQFGLSTP